MERLIPPRLLESLDYGGRNREVVPGYMEISSRSEIIVIEFAYILGLPLT